MRRHYFSRRLRLVLALPALTALLVALGILWPLLGNLLQQSTARQLLDILPIVADSIGPRLATSEAREIQDLAHELTSGTEIRLTLIRTDGVVVADSSRSWEQVLRMDNHSGRPEIAAALQSSLGSSVRQSETTGQRYVYTARIIDTDGARYVLRLAQPLTGLETLRRNLVRALVAASLSALLAMTALLWLLEWRISRAVPTLVAGAEKLEQGEGQATRRSRAGAHRAVLESGLRTGCDQDRGARDGARSPGGCRLRHG
jgi:hypothetical protein